MKPPMMAPTMPIAAVAMRPIESLPGRMARAISPASRPRMIHAMIPM